MIKNNQTVGEINSFKLTIDGSGRCVQKQFNLLSFDDTNHKTFNINAETLIYSNYEQTLSFLVKIEFHLMRKIENLKGFELIFYSEKYGESCVQIIPDEARGFNFHSSDFIFTIKDPSFISYTTNYIFYFGKAYVQALVSCKDGTLCSLTNTKTSTNHIGIVTNEKIDSSPLPIDLCEGHVLRQTCIIRQNFGTLKKPLFYAIIIHPLPSLFKVMRSDLNILELDDDQKNILKKAIEKDQSHVQIGNHKYPTYLLTEEKGLLDQIMVHHIESYQYQKIHRDVVIKVVPQKNEDIYYLGIFGESNENNECQIDFSGPTKCPCENQCKNCYSTHEIGNRTKSLHYIPLPIKSNDNNNKKSQGCSDPFFYPYNFDSVKIINTFQNQSLSNYRKSSYPLKQRTHFDNNLFYNRNFFPAVCFSFSKSKLAKKFDFKLSLKNQHHTAQSTLIQNTNYTVRVYSFDYIKHSNFSFETIKSSAIKPILIFENTMSLDGLTELKNQPVGKYLIEISVKMTNEFCLDSNLCIDESVKNNKVVCVPCNKIIIYLPIFNKQSILTKSNELPKCAKSNTHLEEISLFAIQYGLRERNDYMNYTTENDFSTEEFMIAVKNFQNHLASAVVPSYFQIDSLIFPLINSSQVDMPVYPANPNRYSYMLYIFFVILLILIILLGLHSLDVYYKYKAKEFLLKASYNRFVTFYISYSIDSNREEIIKNLMKKYDFLIKYFPEIKFKTISSNTNLTLRAEFLEKADQIVYICVTSSEIDRLGDPIEIGLTNSHHEYNRIQSGKYREKTVNITFNKNVPSCSTEIHKPIYGEKTSTSYVNKSDPYIDLSNHLLKTNISYLKLPEQNVEFVHLITNSNSYILNENNKNHKYLARPFYVFHTSLNLLFSKFLFALRHNYNNRQAYSLYSNYLLEKKIQFITDEINKILNGNESLDLDTYSSDERIIANEESVLFADEIVEESVFNEKESIKSNQLSETINLIS